MTIDTTTTLPDSDRISATRDYIKQTWQLLRRGHDTLLAAAEDPKLDHSEGDLWPVYLSEKEDIDAVQKRL
ncbi:MAG: alpha,alpha-trehalase, partial [Cyanobacteria bacterium J06650_10]